MTTERTEQLAARTLELCRIESPIGSEATLCNRLEEWAAATALPARREGNALLVQGNRPLGLVGHLDTVPLHSAASPLRREGDQLFGRGASDMKGGLAVMMALLETLPPASRPHAIFYDREEGPYAENGLEPLFRSKLIPEMSLAVCLEPTDNRLQLGCVGSLHATVRFRGRAAHSARPWEGSNAIHAAAPLLMRLAQLERRAVTRGDLTFYEVTQITKIEGGQARNVVPDVCELNLNHRFAPGVPIETAQAYVRELIGPGAEIEFTDLSPSCPTVERNPDVLRLIGLGVPIAAKQAWTDVARFALNGIDAINFGPGQTAQAHQRDEWCDVESLGRCYDLLYRWLT